MACLLVPAAAHAQPRILLGGGLSTPVGSLSDAVDVGWNALAGIQLPLPGIPVGLRADGAYHSFGEASGQPKTSLLGGAASVVVSLPGVGVIPYVLAGVGVYRLSPEGASATSDSGFHGAFGVDLGAVGVGGFAEVRLINIRSSPDAGRLIRATLGVRF